MSSLALVTRAFRGLVSPRAFGVLPEHFTFQSHFLPYNPLQMYPFNLNSFSRLALPSSQLSPSPSVLTNFHLNPTLPSKLNLKSQFLSFILLLHVKEFYTLKIQKTPTPKVLAITSIVQICGFNIPGQMTLVCIDCYLLNNMSRCNLIFKIQEARLQVRYHKLLEYSLTAKG